MRRNAGEVATSIEDLRQTVVRVVRTSTEEANRRLHARFRVEEPCTVVVHGQQHAAVVRDLSEGGAAITGVVGSAGTGGMLILDRRGVRIPFEVRSASGDGMHVRFDLSGGDAGAFRAAFELMTRHLSPTDVAA